MPFRRDASYRPETMQCFDAPQKHGPRRWRVKRLSVIGSRCTPTSVKGAIGIVRQRAKRNRDGLPEDTGLAAAMFSNLGCAMGHVNTSSTKKYRLQVSCLLATPDAGSPIDPYVSQ